jgi:quinol monooxygenase YgiN
MKNYIPHILGAVFVLVIIGAWMLIARVIKPQEEVQQTTEVMDTKDYSQMLVRIAEIEVYEQYLDEYLQAAKSVGSESVAKEEGVICIFPMQVKDEPTTIRIVEIYRDEAAYKSHLQTKHFLKYKQGTLHMVKSLRLVDVNPLAPEEMQRIFKKL